MTYSSNILLGFGIRQKFREFVVIFKEVRDLFTNNNPSGDIESWQPEHFYFLLANYGLSVALSIDGESQSLAAERPAELTIGTWKMLAQTLVCVCAFISV